MAIFELIANCNTPLEGGNIIRKGESVRINVHTLGAQPYNIFSNPENRRQVSQQLSSVGGIDIPANSSLLNNAHWSVRKIPTEFSKTILPDVQPANFEKFRMPWNETSIHQTIDDVEMKKNCISEVKSFFSEGMDMKYADEGLRGRCEMCMDFYENIKQYMGINAELSFKQMPKGCLGGYIPRSNKIELNSSLLTNPDCKETFNTILHESRHAFQEKAISSPDSVSVSNKIIEAWKENMESYVESKYDFEAYENQEIEKDANYFADSVMKKGMNNEYV